MARPHREVVALQGVLTTLIAAIVILDQQRRHRDADELDGIRRRVTARIDTLRNRIAVLEQKRAA